MKRIAFNLIGGKLWFGGYNYQLNLLRALIKYESEHVEPYVFIGEDIDAELLKGFNDIEGLKIVQSEVFNQSNGNKSLIKAILLGSDTDALALFSSYDIDAVFSVAKYFGWRFPIKTIAWIPDFQHRYLTYLFSQFAYLKRDIGFRLQIRVADKVMLSSRDAERDCHHFFPRSKAKTKVVNFAVPMPVGDVPVKDVLASYNLKQDYFFLPNQFWKHKNHRCVIEALHIAKNRNHRLKVVSTGRQSDPRDEHYFPELKSLIEQYQLSEQFILLGAVPYQHVTALMRGCKALLNPSRFEGWSTTVEEAKALGIKMILSDIAVHQEQASEQAIFFDVASPEDLAEKLIHFDNEMLAEEVKDDRIALTEKAMSRVQKYANEFAKLVIT